MAKVHGKMRLGFLNSEGAGAELVRKWDKSYIGLSPPSLHFLPESREKKHEPPSAASPG